MPAERKNNKHVTRHGKTHAVKNSFHPKHSRGNVHQHLAKKKKLSEPSNENKKQVPKPDSSGKNSIYVCRPWIKSLATCCWHPNLALVLRCSYPHLRFWHIGLGHCGAQIIKSSLLLKSLNRIPCRSSHMLGRLMPPHTRRLNHVKSLHFCGATSGAANGSPVVLLNSPRSGTCIGCSLWVEGCNVRGIRLSWLPKRGHFPRFSWRKGWVNQQKWRKHGEKLT